jgi:FkbM family methyltransferase
MINLGNLAQAAIAVYKSRKYRRHFNTKPNVRELDLMLDWLYFLTLPPVKVVYDVGAAEGVFSSGCSRIINIQKVVSLEPNPVMAPALNELARQSAKSIYVPVAAGRVKGSHLFHVTADGHASSCLTPLESLDRIFPGRGVKKSIEVPVETLDEIRSTMSLPYPDLIKIDTQGYEREVLTGAADVLSRASFCIVECCYEKLYENAPLISDIETIFIEIGWRNVGSGTALKAPSGRPVFVDLIFASERGLRVMS